jgi:type I restriction enzyme S subunit
MSTGVDAQTFKLIVLDQNIKSMTLFKQIIGRGTRLREDLGKTWFTILDFKRATELFADPQFDGDPVQIYQPKADDPITPPDEPSANGGADGSNGQADEPTLTPEALADNWQRIATHFDVLLDRPEAVDALEQTILQLAVRGLLVPQDPTDEPASVLLQKIRTEKDQLIAQGKIKRDKSLPPITEEEKPFELPQGWQWVRFDELTHPLKPIAYGVLVPGPDVETGIPFVRIADLSLDSPASKPEKSISPEIDAQFQRTRLEGGEILMGVVGSIGKLGVAPKTWAGANIARAICRIVPADSGLKEFVLFLLQTKFMQESFAGDTRTLAQPTLNVGLIRAALTPLPPPEEQSRIVIRVNELRSLCADLRQRLSFAQGSQSQLAQVLVEQQSIVTF